MSKQPPPAPTASTVGPCPTLIQISRTPWHWKFTQHHRTTRPPLCKLEVWFEVNCQTENTMLVSLISSLSGETRNRVGMARLAEPVQSVSGRA